MNEKEEVALTSIPKLMDIQKVKVNISFREINGFTPIPILKTMITKGEIKKLWLDVFKNK